MSDTDATRRSAALDAALSELQHWGVDRFSLEAVAHRAGVSADFVRQTWDSERQLIADALLSYGEVLVALPDTGSLHGDLTAVALALGAYLNEPVGRRISRMLVIDNKSLAIDTETRGHFWAVRREMVADIFRRARRRGELRDDVKPIVALQLLTSPLQTIALYTDDPVDPDYCRAVADLVTRAVQA